MTLLLRVKTSLATRAIALSTAVLLTGCGGGDPASPGGNGSDAPRVTTITITPLEANLDAPGGMQQLTATVRDQFGAIMAVVNLTWTSSNPAVATVSASGLVTAVTGGSTTITASASGVVSNAVNVTVAVGGTPLPGPLAYVLDFGSLTREIGVSVITTPTNEVGTTIGLGGGLAWDVAVSPAGAYAYAVGVGPRGGSSAWVISTATNTLMATLELIPGPGPLAFLVKFTPDGDFAYVMTESGAVFVISTATHEVVDTIEIGQVASRPIQVEFTPDGSFLYLLDESRTVTVISTANNQVETFVQLGGQPRGPMAMTPNGAFLYVQGLFFGAPGGAADVLVISTATNTIIGAIDLGMIGFASVQPELLVAAPDGESVYSVGNTDNGVVSVISTDTHTVTATVETGVNLMATGGSNFDIEISDDGEFIYLPDRLDNTIKVISTDTNLVTASINVGITPQFLEITRDGRTLYVTNEGSNSVSAISTATNTVEATIPVGNFPRRLAITPF